MNAELLQFLRELREHNDRTWFKANKGRYDILKNNFQDNIQEIINKLSVFDPNLNGLDAKDCLFRIYRDIRFSPNKQPYKTHIGAYMAKMGGRKSEYAGYYLHIEPDNSMVSGGIWMPQPKVLKLLRQDIYDQMDEFIGIIEAPEFKKTFTIMEGEKLIRMPEGFPADTPHGELLKYKNYSVASLKPDSFFTKPDWIDNVVNDFRLQIPFNNFLNYTVDEFYGRG